MSAAPPWWAGYIGIPFVDHGRDRAGLDCWGLVRLVYAEHRGIELPAWDYASCTDTARTAPVVDAHLPEFEIVPPQAWALALFYSAVSGYHIGLLTDPHHLLHVRPKAATVRERLDVVERRIQRVGLYLPGRTLCPA